VQRQHRVRRCSQVGLGEKLALPAVLAVQASADVDPRPQALQRAGLAQRCGGAAKEERRELRRRGGQLTAEVAPRRSGIEPAAAEPRRRDVEECGGAVAAERLAGGEGFAEPQPARKPLGTERRPRRGGAPVVALRQHGRRRGQPITRLQEPRVYHRSQRLRGCVRRGAGGVVEQVATQPDGAHAVHGNYR
jgi:hypothetical protein